MQLRRQGLRAALWLGPASGLCLWLGIAALSPSPGADAKNKVLCAAAPAPLRLAEAAAPAGAAIGAARAAPPALAPENLYSAARTGNFSPATAGALDRVYVPNRQSNSVSVIDPATRKVLHAFTVGISPQHVVPSWDLKTLWVANNGLKARGGSLTPIDPKTGAPGPAIPVDDPYNLYFTPDGKSAIVVAESLKRLDFVIRIRWRCSNPSPPRNATASTAPTFRATGAMRSSPASSAAAVSSRSI